MGSPGSILIARRSHPEKLMVWIEKVSKRWKKLQHGWVQKDWVRLHIKSVRVGISISARSPRPSPQLKAPQWFGKAKDCRDKVRFEICNPCCPFLSSRSALQTFHWVQEKLWFVYEAGRAEMQTDVDLGCPLLPALTNKSLYLGPAILLVPHIYH